MDELSTYSLSDFLPFTPEVYFRLFERQNEALWPAHFLTILLGIAAVWLAWRARGRWAGIVLALCWALVGYTFHIERYANLSWAAEYFGWAFIVQGGLLLASALFGRLDTDSRVAKRPLSEPPFDGPQWAGWGMAIFGLAILPLVGPLTNATANGREWTGIEIFGIAPDPTAIVTLGLVLCTGRSRWLLLIIPLLWCAISGATAWEMNDTTGLLTPAVAILALGAALWKTIQSRRA